MSPVCQDWEAEGWASAGRVLAVEPGEASAGKRGAFRKGDKRLLLRLSGRQAVRAVGCAGFQQTHCIFTAAEWEQPAACSSAG